MTATLEAPSNVEHLMLDHVSWEFYESLLRETEGRRLHITFDNGELEVMTLSRGHEEWKRMCGRLVEMLTWELDIPLHEAGGFTFKMEEKQKGGQPDECYYVGAAPGDRPARYGDPPPDLVIEVDITSRWLPRRPIYAAFGVPEVWAFHGGRVELFRLGDNGEYAPVERSIVLPMLGRADLQRFLDLAKKHDQPTVLRRFQQWVRDDLLTR